MSIVRLAPTTTPHKQALLTKLIQEWRTRTQGLVEPLILEENNVRYSHATHLYIIWSDWGNLNQTDRSEIIMEAYEATHSPDELLSVTVAMGLTPEEAERMEIRYEAANSEPAAQGA